MITKLYFSSGLVDPSQWGWSWATLPPDRGDGWVTVAIPGPLATLIEDWTHMPPRSDSHQSGVIADWIEDHLDVFTEEHRVHMTRLTNRMRVLFNDPTRIHVTSASA